MSCAIPPEMYKYSEGIVRLERDKGRGEIKKPDKLKARRGETHSEGNS